MAVSLAALLMLGMGCDSSPGLPRGMVNFALPAAADATFTVRFVWRIRSSTGTTIASGSFDASDPNATASVSAEVPVGTGDALMLIGSTNDGAVCAGVSAPFNVITDQATSVDLPISCFSVGSGGAQSSVNLANACAAGLSWTVAPSATAAAHFDLSVTPTGLAASGPLSYLWSAVSGSFADTASAQTGYDCESSGGVLASVLAVGYQMPQPCATVATLPFLTCL